MKIIGVKAMGESELDDVILGRKLDGTKGAVKGAHDKVTVLKEYKEGIIAINHMLAVERVESVQSLRKLARITRGMNFMLTRDDPRKIVVQPLARVTNLLCLSIAKI